MKLYAKIYCPQCGAKNTPEILRQGWSEIGACCNCGAHYAANYEIQVSAGVYALSGPGMQKVDVEAVIDNDDDS